MGVRSRYGTPTTRREEPLNSTIPAVRPPTMGPRWTRTDSLDLGAYPSAATSARLHCRALLAEWSLQDLADASETVVGELMANSVEAHKREHLDAPVRLTLLADRCTVLVVVRDASDSPPVPSNPGIEDETGRGLLIVGALAADWGWKHLPGGGKITRALVQGEHRA